MRHYYLRFLFLFFFPSLFIQASVVQPVLRLDKIDSIAVSLSKSWKYKIGDDKSWAGVTCNDSSWDTITLVKDADFTKHAPGEIRWFRLHLKVAPALLHKTLLLLVGQAGASEFYLNGKLIQTFGKVGNQQTEKPFNPISQIYHIELGGDTDQVLAIRFSSSKLAKSSFLSPYLVVNLDALTEVNNDVRGLRNGVDWSIILCAMFFTLSMFHLLLFLYYRKALSNLYYSILALMLAFFWDYPFLMFLSHNPVTQSHINEITLFLFGPCFFLIVLLVYTIFNEKYNWFFWMLLGLTIFTEVSLFISANIYLAAIITQGITSSIKGIITVIRAVRQKKPGAWILAIGFCAFLVIILGIFLFIGISSLITHHATLSMDSEAGQIIAMIWAFSVPTSMSAYLASDFARTNKLLVLEIKHVKNLSAQNIEKEREKQHIIERQKEVLEVKVKEATAEISKQKDELAEKNKEITDSINYARRIQTSILPEEELFRESLGDYLVLYKPKDVVSGDFYWCHSTGDKAIFAVADCTGHGVPGAFMSMIGNSLLNEIVIGGQITEANTILDSLRSKLVITLQQNSQHLTTRDGMDIALCVWDKKTNMLQFAGANNSLYLVSKNIAVNGSVKETDKVKLYNEHLLEILPDKQPIGYQEDKMNNPFTKNIIELHKGDTVFIASDGYTDQFGGERNKKFTSKRFRDLIDSLVGLPLAEQQRILDYTIEDWKKTEAQTDDICLMAVRVN